MRRLSLLSLLACSGAASAAQLSVSSAATHSTGRYGGTEATRLTTASLNTALTAGEWDFSASLPYIRLLAGSEALTVGGVVVKPESDRISGVGDAVLTAGRSLPIEMLPFDLAVEGQLKLPTGSRRLSTGKLDGGIDLELSRDVGPLSPFAAIGYRFYGDTPDLPLDDGWTTSVGASATVAKTTLILSYDWSQSPVGLADGHELFAILSGRLAQQWHWTLFASHGLSEGAADRMLGFGIGRRLRVAGAGRR